MENLLFKYMSDRLTKVQPKKTDFGPVITVSRDYGCYGSEIAEKLSAVLTHESNLASTFHRWSWVSREILEEVALTLEVDPGEITHIFMADEKGFIEDFSHSLLSTKNTSNVKVKKAIIKVVRLYAEKGHTIIVGRAGCVIAKDIQRSFHVKLVAPVKWRTDKIKERFHLSQQEAMKQVKENDERRNIFMRFFQGNKPDSEIFDVIYNRSTMTVDEIVNSILGFVKIRKLI